VDGMLKISVDKQFNVETKEFNEELYLRLYISAFKSGLVSDLKPTNFTVLLTICSYMNAKGECFPTQRQIAERCGISKTTVNKAINELMEYKVNDKPLIERQIVNVGSYKNSVYTVNPVSQVAIFNGDIEPAEKKPEEDKEFKTAKDVGGYFIKVFRDTYGVQPNINYARDYTNVKKKWLGQFTDQQIKKMIEVGVTEYDTRWKSGKFPRPTLSALTSWLGEQALGLSEDNEKEFKEVQEITSNSQEMNDISLNRLANRLNK
jgi:transcriptional regulator with XRE-family HTH domain